MPQLSFSIPNGPFPSITIMQTLISELYHHSLSLSLSLSLCPNLSFSLKQSSALSFSLFSMEGPSSDASATVQHIDRKRSDQLLSKFADERKDWRAPKRRRRDRRESEALGERRSLLQPTKRRSAVLRKLGAIKRLQPGARDVRNKSLLGAIEKTWRRTVEGASRVFMEKHYNRHKRLTDDVV